MKQSVLFFFIFLVFDALPTYSQMVTGCDGQRITGDGSEPICYSQKTNPADNSTIYTITRFNSEIYEVVFKYKHEWDSLEITFIDKIKIGNSYTKSVNFYPTDSRGIIKNFEKNQLPIGDGPYSVLFSINEEDHHFVTLYYFSTMSGNVAQFDLQKVLPEILQKHVDEVRKHDNWIAAIKAHKKKVDDYRQQMEEYKEKTIREIAYNDSNNRLKEATRTGSGVLNTKFISKIDTIFFNYFKNIYPFSDDYRFDVDFKFSCNGNGKIKIDTLKIPDFKGALPKNWLRDSFNVRIKPKIESERFNTVIAHVSEDELISNFDAKFDSVELYDEQTKSLGNTEGITFINLVEERKKLREALRDSVTRDIFVPTLYTYNFKYESTVKNHTWKYVIDKNGTDKFIDKSDKKDRAEITDSLKEIFRNKYRNQGSNTYFLKVCNLSINNGAFNGQDIQIIKAK